PLEAPTRSPSHSFLPSTSFGSSSNSSFLLPLQMVSTRRSRSSSVGCGSYVDGSHSGLAVDTRYRSCLSVSSSDSIHMNSDCQEAGFSLTAMYIRALLAE
uniref:Uncharacterized protein n=1 Tax=Aegilops tauschii subsp. strangulata TaxID=200361 RepID=A0A452XIR0_AEGTS